MKGCILFFVHENIMYITETDKKHILTHHVNSKL